MDHELLAQEVLRALRGKRSQVAWSRRLGYASNVAYPWEAGRRYPTASELFRAVERSGRSVAEALTTFYGRPPAWLAELDPTTPEAICRLLADLRGERTVTELARAAGLNRNAVSRWLLGRTQPRVPDFFKLVDAASVRLPDFLAAFVDPYALPSLTPLWKRIEARREGAAAYPWTQAILRGLELEAYRDLPRHVDGWLSDRLGLPAAEEQRCLAFLELTGEIQWVDARWVHRSLAVDTRRSPAVGRALKVHWSQVAAEHIDAGVEGQFSYNVFSVSRTDFERIRELHLRYFHALRSIVAESEDGDCVAVANVQLFELGTAQLQQK